MRMRMRMDMHAPIRTHTCRYIEPTSATTLMLQMHMQMPICTHMHAPIRTHTCRYIEPTSATTLMLHIFCFNLVPWLTVHYPRRSEQADTAVEAAAKPDDGSDDDDETEPLEVEAGLVLARQVRRLPQGVSGYIRFLSLLQVPAVRS